MASLTLLDPAALPGPASLREARARAAARFDEGPLPTDADEIWRYSRIGELDVGAFRVARPSAPPSVPAAIRRALDLVGERSATVLTVDGALASAEVGDAGARSGLRVHALRDGDPVGGLAASATPWDAFAELNGAQAPTPLVIGVPDGTVARAPVVVCHWTSTAGAVTFPRTLVRVGVNAQVTVLEYHLSAEVAAWVDPVTEIEVADGGHVDHLVVQELGPAVWQTAYVAGTVGRDAALRTFTVALGGDYARVRTDSKITAQAAMPSCWPSTAATAPRCTTSAPSRTTRRPSRRATWCSRGPSPTRPGRPTPG